MPAREPKRRSDDDAGAVLDEQSPPPTPRWVIAFGIIAILLVLMFLISHLAGGGFRSH